MIPSSKLMIAIENGSFTDDSPIHTVIFHSSVGLPEATYLNRRKIHQKSMISPATKLHFIGISHSHEDFWPLPRFAPARHLRQSLLRTRHVTWPETDCDSSDHPQYIHGISNGLVFSSISNVWYTNLILLVVLVRMVLVIYLMVFNG